MILRCRLKNKLFGFLYAMNYIANAAWAFVFPTALLIALGWVLWQYAALGKWVMAVAIILGVLCGLYNMFVFLVRMADYSSGDWNRDDKKKR